MTDPVPDYSTVPTVTSTAPPVDPAADRPPTAEPLPPLPPSLLVGEDRAPDGGVIRTPS